jgi:hypothetical protein
MAQSRHAGRAELPEFAAVHESGCGPSATSRHVRDLVAIEGNLLQNYFGTQSEEHFFKSSPL